MRKIQPKEYTKIPIYKEYILESYGDGNIPVSRFESWKDFQTQFQNAPDNIIYRGHKIGSWDLSSSFSRLCNRPEVTEIKGMLNIFKTTLKEMELKDEAGNFYHEYNDDHLWGIGRHHGLSTPTLDWSHDPLVALFFAFEDADNNDAENPYSAIYLLDKDYINLKLKDEITLIDSIHTNNERAINQKGLFSLTTSHVPLENIIVNDQGNSHKYFRKIYVRRIDQKNCIQELDKKGINKKSLYPNSIEGAVHYSNLKGRKFFRSIFPGGSIITFQQKVIDPDDEKEKIRKNLESIYPNSESNEICFAAKTIFDLFCELRRSDSRDSNFIKKLDEYYNLYISN